MNFFKSNLVALFLIGMVSLASSQITMGLKTGINVADAQLGGLNSRLFPNISTHTGFSAGAWSEIPLLNGFSFRPELNYTQKGFRASGDLSFLRFLGINLENLPIGVGIRTRLNTIEAPLLFKYSHGNEIAKFYAILGPNIAYSTDGFARPVVEALFSFNLPAQNINLSNDIFRRWELSGTIGVGGEVKAGNGKIFADVRYNHGINSLLNNPIIDLEIRNKSFGVHVGYGYTL